MPRAPLEILKSTIGGICGIQNPTTKTELWSFSSLCMYSPLVAKLGPCCRPDEKVICKGQPQAFDRLADVKNTTLETLKARLVESSLPPLTSSKGDYSVDADACDKQIGHVLLQKQPDGTNRPVGYRSRLLIRPSAHRIPNIKSFLLCTAAPAILRVWSTYLGD